MKFDVVIGNPPYNRGMDIDFVFMGHEIARECSVFITPAKWQTAEANQRIASEHSYGDFRREIVPHISDVVFYPWCTDAFDIWQTDGVCYFKIHKNEIFNEQNIKNICSRQKHFNSELKRSIANGATLINVGSQIIDYINKTNIKQFKFMNYSGNFHVVTNTQSPGGGVYGMSEDGKAHYVGVSDIYTEQAKGLAAGASKDIFSSDNLDECKSFISWLNTRFTRFFVACNISKLGPILTDHYFRFVPAPPSEQQGHPEDNWNHIYTDEELYEYFGLNKEEAKTADGIRYRDIIDSVIKERK